MKAISGKRCIPGLSTRFIAQIRCFQSENSPSERKRQRWAHFWIPQASKQDEASQDVTQLLTRAGYLRQAYSGIYHMLPLGLRVQQKLEQLIDKHMTSLKASKVSLSSISSQKLWDKSGRLSGGTDKEFFTFRDRKDVGWLLAPTHEEEITNLVKELVFAPTHLPLRLYQISRKYRDEKRPRGGLLRGREFIMKDLYTFDKTDEEAHETYRDVRQAYRNLFKELKIPYIEAQADSGNMGGDLSHEFHFPSAAGEDDIITCSQCDLARNEEYVPTLETLVEPLQTSDIDSASKDIPMDTNYILQSFLSVDGNTLVRAFAKPAKDLRNEPKINPVAVKAALKNSIKVNTGIEDPLKAFDDRRANRVSEAGQAESKAEVLYLFDQHTDHATACALIAKDQSLLKTKDVELSVAMIKSPQERRSHLLAHQDGDECPKCDGEPGKLKVTKAIEVGHTFHLGNRYSSKLDFHVPLATNKQKNSNFPSQEVSMGCHGIGVSRLIAAVASALSDEQGLNWPRAMAPFEVIVLAENNRRSSQDAVETANELYDELSQKFGVDVLIDDREASFGWKFNDADLIGYPIIVVVGRALKQSRAVEIQCRRLGVKEEVPIESAPSRVNMLLAQL